MTRRAASFISILILAWLSISPALADEPAQNAEIPSAEIPAGVDPDSLLFQSDYFVHHEWRIQRHSETGKFRLVDGRDQVLQRGSFAECRDRFAILSREAKLPPVDGKVVILLHGMFRNHRAGIPMEASLKEAGYQPIRVGYASTRTDIEEHAAALKSVISYLPDAKEIYFVAHSMGSIVVRKYLSDSQEADRKLDPRIKRFVMLGPPNQGSSLALSAGSSNLFNQVKAPGIAQLGVNSKEFLGALREPRIEYGILAGSTGEGSQGSPLLAGADDLVVRVEETKLPGAADFLVLPIIHMRMFSNPKVKECVLNFLAHGYFIAEDQRMPLPREILVGE